MTGQPQNLEQWLAFLTAAEIPVLRRTAREIERLREHEDDLGAREIANVVVQDPLMTAKLLRYLQDNKHPSQLRDLVQVEQAIIMIGLTAFFRDVPSAPVVEEMLQGHLEAMTRLLRSVKQAQRAARYAFDWALLLHDLHAEEAHRRAAKLSGRNADVVLQSFADAENPSDAGSRQNAAQLSGARRGARIQGH